MRALIWKEVREQVKWAMLWLIAIGLACGAALSAVSVRDWDNVSLLCSRLFYAVMLFGATSAACCSACSRHCRKRVRGAGRS